MSELTGRSFSGQVIEVDQVLMIQRTVSMFSALSRRELGHTICEHLGWYTPTGSNRIHSCLGLLDCMEELGLIVLPAKDSSKVRTSQRAIRWSEQSVAGALIEASLEQLQPLRVELVTEVAAIRQFNELLDRHHYLGYRRPIGPHLRYFVLDGAARKLGCLLFSYAVRRQSCRDEWIGWQDEVYKKQLHLVVNNVRFLIFPWVRVSNLASKVLSLVCRRLADDWQDRHGYRPVLLETYVDDSRFRGSCYRAANWQRVGFTDKRSGKTTKSVYVYPLVKDFRSLLCAGLR